MNCRFWSAVSCGETEGWEVCSALGTCTTPHRPHLSPPYLSSAHFGQLLQEDLQEVALHPIGGLAVGVQYLGGEQLQQLLNLSEERGKRPW